MVGQRQRWDVHMKAGQKNWQRANSMVAEGVDMKAGQKNWQRANSMVAEGVDMKEETYGDRSTLKILHRAPFFSNWRKIWI